MLPAASSSEPCRALCRPAPNTVQAQRDKKLEGLAWEGGGGGRRSWVQPEVTDHLWVREKPLFKPTGQVKGCGAGGEAWANPSLSVILSSTSPAFTSVWIHSVRSFPTLASEAGAVLYLEPYAVVHHMDEKRPWRLMLSVIQSRYHPTSNLWGFKVPLHSHFFTPCFNMIIPGVFNTIYFNTWRKTHFLLLLTVGYQSTEAFDWKTKQKANTWGQIMPSVERNCECGLENWVESQEENDMDFLEQTEEKSRSNFSTFQLCHCPFKAFTVTVWWSRSKAMDTEVTLQ